MTSKNIFLYIERIENTKNNHGIMRLLTQSNKINSLRTMQILFRNRKLHPKCICFEHFGYALFALYDSIGQNETHYSKLFYCVTMSHAFLIMLLQKPAFNRIVIFGRDAHSLWCCVRFEMRVFHVCTLFQSCSEVRIMGC